MADGAADAAPTQEEESAGRFEAARAPSSRGAEFDYSGAVAYNREEHRYHCLTCCTATTEEHRWLEHSLSTPCLRNRSMAYTFDYT